MCCGGIENVKCSRKQMLGARNTCYNIALESIWKPYIHIELLWTVMASGRRSWSIEPNWNVDVVPSQICRPKGT